MNFWNRERGARICRMGNGAWLRSLALALMLVFWAAGASAQAPSKESEPFTMIVLDPLAKELACACVKGYGQRDYRKLAARLETVLKQPVGIEFSDDLADTLATIGVQREYIVAGERSLVAHGAKAAGLPCTVLCDLTGQEGETSLNALFLVRANDPAKELKDIGARKVLFGVPEADAKHAAATETMRAAGVKPSATEQRLPYTDAALDVLDSEESPLPVAVVPGYALRLLQGCGSINPGDLRVIGKTEMVPFISLFVSDNIPTPKEKKILETLLAVKDDAKLLKEMESKAGFKSAEPEEKQPQPASDQPASLKPREKVSVPNVDWPDWRGPNRDGRVPRLPAKLPATANIVWKKGTMTGGLAGLSVRDGRLIVAERDFADEMDVYRCINAHNGELIWRITFPASGSLDYGQFPRAAPVITETKAYLLGAFGELRCVDVKDGKLIWKRALPEEFKAELPTWGMCSTPLLVGDLLIVNPGATNASLVALDCTTGETRWTVPGDPAGYSSFILGEFGGLKQIVGYDEKSLGGWDIKTGKRLWKLVPPMRGDFNVPTPIAVEGGLIVSTENNGTRFYRFDDSGCIVPKPAAEYANLFPDTSTPVLTGGRLFGAHLGLHCLDVNDGLKTIWNTDDRAIGDYASLIADDQRVLITTLSGELLLLDSQAASYAPISRLRIFEEEVEVYSHPALVGTRLYVRGGSSLLCIDLGTEQL